MTLGFLFLCATTSILQQTIPSTCLLALRLTQSGKALPNFLTHLSRFGERMYNPKEKAAFAGPAINSVT